MKVVVRSSSLLFTLLSILFQVPIRRAKRTVIVTKSPDEHPSSNDSQPEQVVVVGGDRRHGLL